MYKEILDKLLNNPFSLSKSDFEKLSDKELEEINEVVEMLEKKFDNDQYSKKIQINSLYGALANKYFPLFDIRLAESITGFGRYYIKDIGEKVNDFLMAKYPYEPEFPALIYTHTDSTYFQMKPVIESDLEEYLKNNPDKDFVDFLLKVGNEYLGLTDAVFIYISKLCNTKEPEVLKMEFENVADKGIWTAAARYFVRASYNKKRLAKPKMKITGMEIIKSSTPSFSKEIIIDSLGIMLDGSKEDILEFIETTKLDFRNQNPNLIAFNRGVSDIEKFLIYNPRKIPVYDAIHNMRKDSRKNVPDDKLLKENLKDIIVTKIGRAVDGDSEIIDISMILDGFSDIERLFYRDTIALSYFERHKDIILKKSKKYNEFNGKDIFIETVYNKEELLAKKGTPVHVKAAIAYNNFIKENKYNLPLIYNGDKIKFFYLLPNNIFGSSVVAYKDDEFLNIVDLSLYIDYNKQFEKAFISPLKEITNALNIDHNMSGKNKLIEFESYFT